MPYRRIDMETYPRKKHFAYFDGMAYPYVGVTVNVEITAMLAMVRERKLPLFLTLCYCVARAANRVPEFRQRIVEHQIVEFDACPTSHTVALPDGTYCYCDLESGMPFEAFIPYAVEAQERAKARNSIDEDAGDVLDKLLISTLPWLSFTALINPTPVPADSNPRITWGKFFEQDGRTLLPVAVLCHHALVDGLHIARFFDFLNEEMTALVR